MAHFIHQLKQVALRPWLETFKRSCELLPGCLERRHRSHLDAVAESIVTASRLPSAASSGRRGLDSRLPEQARPRCLQSSSHSDNQGS